MTVFRSMLNSKDESFICSVLHTATISVGNTFNHWETTVNVRWVQRPSTRDSILQVLSLVGSPLLKHCGFHRTFRLCQPCQDLPKGVACQSAKCVRARQKPGRITSPAWPGAPSCPWTTAQLWTGNKKWEIQLQTYSSPQLDQRLCLFPTLNGLIDPK